MSDPEAPAQSWGREERTRMARWVRGALVEFAIAAEQEPAGTVADSTLPPPPLPLRPRASKRARRRRCRAAAANYERYVQRNATARGIA